METTYAVLDPVTGRILHESKGYGAAPVTQEIPLTDGTVLRICGEPSQKELLSRLEAAEAANTAKEAFLSNMSHDIRTPMNAIVGMTALAQKHIDEKSRVADALEKIETASGHLLSLINDVLDMSRINSGHMQLTLDRFSLGDLLHDLLILAKPLIDAKHHTFTLITDNVEVEEFSGDILRLRQIYINILSNAIKYTPASGQITLTVESHRQENQALLRFVCQDNGIGMEEAFLQRIFVPFERVQSSTLSGVEGTGLGMSIVRKLIDAMNGTIAIQSAPGKGTVVSIDIPLALSASESTLPALRDIRVLALESQKARRGLLMRYLKGAGVFCALAASAQEALAVMAEADISQSCFHVIVLGESIEGAQDVLDVAEYLHKARPDIPLVLYSARKWEDIEYRARKCGIISFIPVPFFQKSLLSGIASALTSASSSAPLTRYPDLTGQSILLVEDNLINQEIACEILSMTHVHIDTAENGKEAVERFVSSRQGTYALIFMDIQMPVMDGYAATRAIRESTHPDAQTIPIFAMTANTFAEDIEKTRACGMNGHISKPVDIDHLMQVLQTLTERGA